MKKSSETGRENEKGKERASERERAREERRERKVRETIERERDKEFWLRAVQGWPQCRNVEQWTGESC